MVCQINVREKPPSQVPARQSFADRAFCFFMFPGRLFCFAQKCANKANYAD